MFETKKILKYFWKIAIVIHFIHEYSCVLARNSEWAEEGYGRVLEADPQRWAIFAIFQ